MERGGAIKYSFRRNASRDRPTCRQCCCAGLPICVAAAVTNLKNLNNKNERLHFPHLGSTNSTILGN